MSLKIERLFHYILIDNYIGSRYNKDTKRYIGVRYNVI
jgi:hypothetical protein